ncbi:hypothetical protein CSKR_107100 [Clonorchis sinensis]|uniref:Uncharacterized protein n=1 Tax=Clonorchis sinensis TaxID=79923 RepID=A0A3R7G5D6_CLOSI|nr:hypothetical protein CSKR_107100 [Clonorchis sinensis]
MQHVSCKTNEKKSEEPICKAPAIQCVFVKRGRGTISWALLTILNTTTRFASFCTFGFQSTTNREESGSCSFRLTYEVRQSVANGLDMEILQGDGYVLNVVYRMTTFACLRHFGPRPSEVNYRKVGTNKLDVRNNYRWSRILHLNPDGGLGARAFKVSLRAENLHTQTGFCIMSPRIRTTSNKHLSDRVKKLCSDESIRADALNRPITSGFNSHVERTCAEDLEVNTQPNFINRSDSASIPSIWIGLSENTLVGIVARCQTGISTMTHYHQHNKNGSTS